jgi:hypothetical protein
MLSSESMKGAAALIDTLECLRRARGILLLDGQSAEFELGTGVNVKVMWRDDEGEYQVRES